MGKHYEQLTAEERAAIMMMKANNCSARQIALTLRRAPSTITRELARFAAWPDRPTAVACTPAQYDARAAGLRARRARFKCRKRSKLASDTVLRCGPALPGAGLVALADRGHTQAHVAR